MAQAPRTTTSAVTPTAGNVATNGLRVGPSVVRGVRAKRAEHRRRHQAGGHEQQGEPHPAPVGAEGGDEHEQDRAGHERLPAAVGLERERVAEQHDQGDADEPEHRPTAFVRHGRDRLGELGPDEREVGRERVPRRPRGEERENVSGWASQAVRTLSTTASTTTARTPGTRTTRMT